MNKHTIYCTPEQTKKALELGAKIETQEYCPPGEIEPDWFHDEDKCYHIPTAEQMIGWLEEQGEILSIEITVFEGYWEGYVKTINYKDAIFKDGYETRKEATLAAIDAALEYLISQNHDKK